MKKIFLTLVVALVAVPGYLCTTATAASVPASSEETVQGPVDDLIKQMNKLFALIGNDKDYEDLTAAQQGQYRQIAADINALREKHASYKLTPSDREILIRWARTTNEKISGEKMTATEVAELRDELNSYVTFGDLTEDLDLNEL